MDADRFHLLEVLLPENGEYDGPQMTQTQGCWGLRINSDSTGLCQIWFDQDPHSDRVAQVTSLLIRVHTRAPTKQPHCRVVTSCVSQSHEVRELNTYQCWLEDQQEQRH
jgi:hypothetical protein